MRISSYFLLLLAFACGVAGSFLVAATFFWAKPVKVVAKNMPKTNIIVAKRDIPVGGRFEASAVQYFAAPIDEIPETAVLNFRTLHNKKSLYDIPQGCPICTEMLTEATVQGSETEASVPPGFRVVPIQIEGCEMLDTPFVPGTVTDIALSPRPVQGELVEKRNAVLGNDPAEERKVILEKVSVHSVQTSVASKDANGQPRVRVEEVAVLLSGSQFETLLTSSREGILRLVPHETELARAALKKDDKKSEDEESKEDHGNALVASTNSGEEPQGFESDLPTLADFADANAKVANSVPLANVEMTASEANEANENREMVGTTEPESPRPLFSQHQNSVVPKAEQLTDTADVMFSRQQSPAAQPGNSVQFGNISQGNATLRVSTQQIDREAESIARTATHNGSGATFVRPTAAQTAEQSQEKKAIVNGRESHSDKAPASDFASPPPIRKNYSPFNMGAKGAMEIP